MEQFGPQNSLVVSLQDEFNLARLDESIQPEVAEEVSMVFHALHEDFEKMASEVVSNSVLLLAASLLCISFLRVC